MVTAALSIALFIYQAAPQAIGCSARSADLSHDFFTVLKTNYTVPLCDHIRVRLEYAIYNRHLHFKSQSAYDTSESLVGASLDYRF